MRCAGLGGEGRLWRGRGKGRTVGGGRRREGRWEARRRAVCARGRRLRTSCPRNVLEIVTVRGYAGHEGVCLRHALAETGRADYVVGCAGCP